MTSNYLIYGIAVYNNDQQLMRKNEREYWIQRVYLICDNLQYNYCDNIAIYNQKFISKS